MALKPGYLHLHVSADPGGARPATRPAKVAPQKTVQSSVQSAAPRSPQRRFEDLIAWRRARLLCREVYRLSAGERFNPDPDLVKGLRAACVNIMTHLAEGFERRSLNDFYAFTQQAKAACAAARSQMYVAQDAGYLDEDDMTFLVDLSEDVLEVIGNLQRVIVRRMG